VTQLDGYHERSVDLLCFSNGEENYLLSIGGDDRHSITIFDWKKSKEIVTAVGHSDKARFHIFY
jgi:hypothetical protein